MAPICDALWWVCVFRVASNLEKAQRLRRCARLGNEISTKRVAARFREVRMRHRVGKVYSLNSGRTFPDEKYTSKGIFLHQNLNINVNPSLGRRGTRNSPLNGVRQKPNSSPRKSSWKLMLGGLHVCDMTFI